MRHNESLRMGLCTYLVVSVANTHALQSCVSDCVHFRTIEQSL